MTRRSSRLRVRIAVLVKSLDRAIDFSCDGVALVVNAHGCAVQTTRPLPIGTPVEIQVHDGGEASARVVECQALGQHDSDWIIALELAKPANIWGLKSPPEDWLAVEGKRAQSRPVTFPRPQTAVHLKMPAWPLAATSAKNDPPAASASPEVMEQLAEQAETIARLKDELAASRLDLTRKIENLFSQSQERTLAQAGQQFGLRLDAVAHSYDASLAGLREDLTAAIRAVPENLGQQLSDLKERTLAEAHAHFNTVLTDALRPLREELARSRDRIEESQQLHAVSATRLQDVPEMVERHARRLFDSWMQAERAELQPATNSTSSDEEAVRTLLSEVSSAREGLETSLRDLPQRIQQPIQAAVEEVLTRARAELGGQILEDARRARVPDSVLSAVVPQLMDSLRAERDAISAQIDALRFQREEFRQWFGQQETHTRELAQRLEQVAAEITEHATCAVEQKLLANVVQQSEMARNSLQEQLAPMLKEAADLREKTLALFNSLRAETESHEARTQAFRREKQQLETWIVQRTCDFQKSFNDALVETTGQIKGRLQMAMQMMEEPFVKLRNEASHQLQHQSRLHAQELQDQVSQLSDRLARLRSEVEHAVHEALRAQATEASAVFGRELAEAAQRSVEQWQASLAQNLAEISQLLTQQLSHEKK